VIRGSLHRQIVRLASLDNLLFLLLIAVAALFQLLSKAISKAGKSDSNETPSSPKPQTPRPIQRAPRESDADRIRKFLEALGQPPSSTPPPPVLPRSNIPPRPLAPVQPPPVIIPGAFQLPQTPRQKPDITRRETALPEQPTRLQEIVSPTVPPPATPAVEGHEALAVEPQQSPIIEIPVEPYAAPKLFQVTKGIDFKTDISALLASKSSLREAILLREILGPPRGLQALDLP
jgi:hypothetical protein